MRRVRVEHPYEGGVDWAFMRTMDIADSAAPHLAYLRRFIIFKTPLCALYVHFIYTADGDQDLHNHPMGFLSTVLRGGYTEVRRHLPDVSGMTWVGITVPRKRYRWSIARTTRKDFHRIVRLHDTERPTVTLLLCGPRKQTWGFLTSQGFVDYRSYAPA